MYSREEEEVLRQELRRIGEKLEEILASERRIDRWTILFQKIQLDDFIYNYTRPLRIIVLNLIAGLSRGLGFTLGTTIIVAFIILILKNFVTLPIIGEYIARLIDMIDYHRQLNG